MAEALLLSVMRGVVGKAGDVLVQRVTRMWGVDGDREKMEDRLVYVSRMLVDAEVKAETDPAVKRWMKNLKAVAYQADDILDNFQYEALHREAQGPRSMTSKVLSNFTHHSPLLFRLKISWELKNVLDKLEGLVSDMNQFGLLERAEVPQVVNRQKHSALDKHEEIFGRNNDKEMIVKLLLDHQDQQSVQVLPIIGMGENFEATAIVRSVIELATKGTCDLRDNIELLKGRLQEVIGRKRFLLILDDVWNNEQHKWEEDLKPLLCSCIGGSGSTIVVTSRLQHVASIMGTLPSYELKILSEEDSWKLFSKKAFINKGLQEQTELFPVGKRIVDKCKGLPLALKTMGGLMSSKQQVQEWKAIAHCSISDTSRGKHEVLSILKLSYTHLSSEMKQCFAFCAIFPKDYEMEKNMLIQLWMANGFILEEGAMDLTDKEMAVELKSSKTCDNLATCCNCLTYKSDVYNANDKVSDNEEQVLESLEPHGIGMLLAPECPLRSSAAFQGPPAQSKASFPLARFIAIQNQASSIGLNLTAAMPTSLRASWRIKPVVGAARQHPSWRIGSDGEKRRTPSSRPTGRARGVFAEMPHWAGGSHRDPVVVWFNLFLQFIRFSKQPRN
ncbi:hypothetical protein PR202_gb02500 [Eleusine coracana subsp. coracana]|uniref:Uncharacterized protein n=1 Tax=Eleusine coracana subsp. coracana TaxID=191504 RepID=A0AAV5DYN1_ELECO|nr:hypothetical protein PR202_gb02500 [Eleusine coracana subsp. coracana]